MKIRVVLDKPLYDGMSVTFKAPCDCTEVDGLIVYYRDLTEETSEQKSKTFIFSDAHNVHLLQNLGNLFASGAYVKAILNTSDNRAYIQNADTNSYLEKKIKHNGRVLFSDVMFVDDFFSRDIIVQGISEYRAIVACFKLGGTAETNECAIPLCSCDGRYFSGSTYIKTDGGITWVFCEFTVADDIITGGSWYCGDSYVTSDDIHYLLGLC